MSSLFSIVATTKLGAVVGKKTTNCFTGSRYSHRDSNLDDSWFLPLSCPKASACVITTLAPSRCWTFAEGAAVILGINTDTSIALLSKRLIERGHTMNLAQVEKMVEKTESGEKTEMRTYKYGNFFFVETGNENNSVSVDDVHRVEHDWNANIFSLGDSCCWSTIFSLLARNLDPAILGT